MKKFHLVLVSVIGIDSKYLLLNILSISEYDKSTTFILHHISNILNPSPRVYQSNSLSKTDGLYGQ